MQNDFDIASLSYDSVFTNTSIGQAQRKQVYKQLDKVVKKDKKLHILELNCGTGEDANYLHKLGHTIFATDISEGMIKQAKKKYTKINFNQLDISKIKNEKLPQKLDLIFSNFGGFNCLSKKELAVFFTSISKKIVENGKIILIIMPKNTLWERIYFSFKRDFKKAFRRNTSNAIKANVEGVAVKTWYFNPDEILEMATNFSVKKIKPIGLFVPPSYLQNSILGSNTVITFLNVLDGIFQFSFLAKYADHYYIELQKNTDL